jgi:hypothetical protein
LLRSILERFEFGAVAHRLTDRISASEVFHRREQQKVFSGNPKSDVGNVKRTVIANTEQRRKLILCRRRRRAVRADPHDSDGGFIDRRKALRGLFSGALDPPIASVTRTL